MRGVYAALAAVVAVGAIVSWPASADPPPALSTSHNNAVPLDGNNAVMNIPFGLWNNGTVAQVRVWNIPVTVVGPVKIVDPSNVTIQSISIEVGQQATFWNVNLSTNGTWTVKGTAGSWNTIFYTQIHYANQSRPAANSSLVTLFVVPDYKAEVKAVVEATNTVYNGFERGISTANSNDNSVAATAGSSNIDMTDLVEVWRLYITPYNIDFVTGDAVARLALFQQTDITGDDKYPACAAIATGDLEPSCYIPLIRGLNYQSYNWIQATFNQAPLPPITNSGDATSAIWSTY